MKSSPAVKNRVHRFHPQLDEPFPSLAAVLRMPLIYRLVEEQRRGDPWSTQSQYPAWYFLYSSIEGEAWLSDVCGIPRGQLVITFTARTVGGTLIRRGAAAGLIDGPPLTKRCFLLAM